jgi:hypothetical protein
VVATVVLAILVLMAGMGLVLEYRRRARRIG